MNNTQRKKIKMLYSFQEGYMKPPYPYSFKIRGWLSKESYILHLKGSYCRRKAQHIKIHAGCRICDGYGYQYTHSYNETEDCVCVAKYGRLYSKKAYRFWT